MKGFSVYMWQNPDLNLELPDSKALPNVRLPFPFFPRGHSVIFQSYRSVKPYKASSSSGQETPTSLKSVLIQVFFTNRCNRRELLSLEAVHSPGDNANHLKFILYQAHISALEPPLSFLALSLGPVLLSPDRSSETVPASRLIANLGYIPPALSPILQMILLLEVAADAPGKVWGPNCSTSLPYKQWWYFKKEIMFN